MSTPNRCLIKQGEVHGGIANAIDACPLNSIDGYDGFGVADGYRGEVHGSVAGENTGI